MIEKSELVPQDIWDRIPEEDKVCINCEHFGNQTERGTNLCHGTMPCCNFHDGHRDNYFEPDDMYLLDTFGCDACVYYAHGEPTEECSQCSRYYSDQWCRRVQ